MTITNTTRCFSLNPTHDFSHGLPRRNRFCLLLVISLLLFSFLSHAQFQKITNDQFWNTSDGKPIYSQGGGIFRFTDAATGKEKYYWYGVHYKEAELYRDDPSITLPKTTFESVTCYSSTDLVNWTFEANVLSKDELTKHAKPTWVGRLGVAWINELRQYALFVQHGNGVLIAVSKTPTGNFEWHQRLDMTEMIGTPNTGDQTVFTDEDSGKSYLIYSYGRGRNKIYVSEIGMKDGKVGLLDCTKVFQGESREGNCMFKHKGRYYMCASNIYGWDASYAYYLVANDIRGPYYPVNDMQVMPGCENDYAHVTQTGFFINVKGDRQETIMYCGDRWANYAGNGLGYNQWFPISFTDTLPHFNSLQAWWLNEQTGEWKVADDNNYVKNGSFEADRRTVPLKVKPAQLALTGWTTVIVKGNPVSYDSLVSPMLNNENTAADRKVVTGEKSLQVSDKVSFHRKVYQEIKATPFVPLPDGNYQLTLWIKNSEGFTDLQLYAKSEAGNHKLHIRSSNKSWKEVKMTNIKVTHGVVEIGIEAKGVANAFCYVDDISFVRIK